MHRLTARWRTRSHLERECVVYWYSI
jgi:hypothetical protein